LDEGGALHIERGLLALASGEFGLVIGHHFRELGSGFGFGDLAGFVFFSDGDCSCFYDGSEVWDWVFGPGVLFEDVVDAFGSGHSEGEFIGAGFACVIE